MMVENNEGTDSTRRLNVKKQTLDDAYAAPANFLEIDIVNPMTTLTSGKKRYTDYEVRMKVCFFFYNFFCDALLLRIGVTCFLCSFVVIAIS